MNIVQNQTTLESAQPLKKGLGRGLAAFYGDEDNNKELSYTNINPSDLDSSTQFGQASKISIELLKPNPDQPRQIFNEEALDALAESIRIKGILQPILVRPHPEERGKYQIIAGERRWRAAQKAKLHEVPINILPLKDTDTLEIALIENIHRQDLNILEEAEGYQQLISRYDYTQESVSKAVGKSRSHVANLLRLLNLPEEIKAMLQDGHITMGHARALLSAKNPIQLANEVIEKDYNVRELETIIQNQVKNNDINNILSTNPNVKSKARELSKTISSSDDPNVKSLIQDLSLKLGMNVDIILNSNSESGLFQIEFKTLDQLDDLVMMLFKDKNIPS